jgi:cyclic pyranopterin phosphate synthase
MDNDKNNLNTHKLMYHPDRVSEWLLTGDTIPIYVEVSPSIRCNAHCKFCAYGSADRKVGRLEEDKFTGAYLSNALPGMQKLGVRSVMFCGEGEPLMNENIVGMVTETADAGIDVSVTSNGIRIWSARTIIAYLKWIKFSIDAGTAETYSGIKGIPSRIYEKLLTDIESVCSVEKKFRTTLKGRGCTIGAQMVVVPENYMEVTLLAEWCKKAGVDYLALKPFTPSDYTTTKFDKIEYGKIIEFLDEVVPSIDYNVIYRKNAFSAVHEKECTSVCRALPFWMYISSNGDIYPCLSYYGYSDYVLGNLFTDDIVDIWESDRRLEIYKKIEEGREHCRLGCRMTEVNKYLEAISNPPDHVNFI